MRMQRLLEFFLKKMKPFELLNNVNFFNLSINLINQIPDIFFHYYFFKQQQQQQQQQQKQNEEGLPTMSPFKYLFNRHVDVNFEIFNLTAELVATNESLSTTCIDPKLKNLIGHDNNWLVTSDVSLFENCAHLCKFCSIDVYTDTLIVFDNQCIQILKPTRFTFDVDRVRLNENFTCNTCHNFVFNCSCDGGVVLVFQTSNKKASDGIIAGEKKRGKRRSRDACEILPIIELLRLYNANNSSYDNNDNNDNNIRKILPKFTFFYLKIESLRPACSYVDQNHNWTLICQYGQAFFNRLVEKTKLFYFNRMDRLCEAFEIVSNVDQFFLFKVEIFSHHCERACGNLNDTIVLQQVLFFKIDRPIVLSERPHGGVCFNDACGGLVVALEKLINNQDDKHHMVDYLSPLGVVNHGEVLKSCGIVSNTNTFYCLLDKYFLVYQKKIKTKFLKFYSLKSFY